MCQQKKFKNAATADKNLQQECHSLHFLGHFGKYKQASKNYNKDLITTENIISARKIMQY
jgi:hypothetical protein